MKIFLSLFLLVQACSLEAKISIKKFSFSSFIVQEKQITLADYPDAFNPSILKVNDGYLLSFRYCPNRSYDYLSYIGIARLNDQFECISSPQLLDMRISNPEIPSHTEDARLISVDEKIYLLFNDDPISKAPTPQDRRDIFLAELIINDTTIDMMPAVKLKHPLEYENQRIQKNWTPFDWKGTLLLSYQINPHEILSPDLETGEATPLYKTKIPKYWPLGQLRGGTPAQLVDNEYLAFFHSSTMLKTPASPKHQKYHYFMGAYTFEKDPPFRIKKFSLGPIVGSTFYSAQDVAKHVIFPGGFVYTAPYLYVVYGRDDREIWLVIIDKKGLMEHLEGVQF